jgi:hypothetical protein
MPELDQRIAHYIDTVARPVTAEEARSRAPRVQPRRRTRRVAIGAVLAAACVAGGVVLASTRATTSRSPRVNVSNTPTTAPVIPPRSAHAAPHEGGPVYFAPSSIPAGFTLVRAERGNEPGNFEPGGGSPEWTKVQTWVKFDAAHETVLENLHILWGPKTVRIRPGSAPEDLIASDERESVPVHIRDTTGYYNQRVSSLIWEEPRGTRVAIECERCTLATLERVAGEIEPQPDGDFAWPAPHDGFELEATAPGYASLGANVRDVVYTNGHGAGFVVGAADDPQEPPFAQFFDPATKVVDLRDTQGIIGSRINTPSFGGRPDTVFTAKPGLAVQWLEYPNIAVTVGGSGLTEQQLLQIAAGVHEVTAVEWARLGGRPYIAETGTAPDAATSAAITHAFDAWLDGAHPDAQWPFIEDADTLRPAILAARATNGAAQEYSGSIGKISMLDTKSASVSFTILRGGQAILTNTGLAIDDRGMWKVARETVCATISAATVFKDSSDPITAACSAAP